MNALWSATNGALSGNPRVWTYRNEIKPMWQDNHVGTIVGWYPGLYVSVDVPK